MFQAAYNNLVIQVDTKWVADFYNMIRMSNMNPGTQVNPADFVQIVGKVVSVPKSLMGGMGLGDFAIDDIRPGDHAIFRYDVIYNIGTRVNERGEAEGFFKNMVWYYDEYWVCSIDKLFAVIRDGEIIMKNGYVMVEEVEQPSAIILPALTKRMVKDCSARLTHIGKNLKGQPRIEAEEGDIIFFNFNKLQQYQTNSKKFGVLSQSHILGRIPKKSFA